MKLAKANIFDQIKPANEREIVEKIFANGDICIERIISAGQSSPEGFWYDQPQNEWVIVLKGRGIIEFEDRLIELGTGDYIFIAAHRKHRVKFTDLNEETIWLAVHFK